MHHITFYYDPISPYAYLAFQQMPRSLQGLSYSVCYIPILFAGLLKSHGQLGPAETPPKRDWTYRHVLWQAKHLDTPFQMPSAHPFNPLPLLRLAIAAGRLQANGVSSTNRFVTEKIFYHVWHPNESDSNNHHAPYDAANSERLAQLAKQLMPSTTSFNNDAVKERLKFNTDQALQAGLFGVPSFVVDQKVFWGLDSLPMLREYMVGNAWFDAADGWSSVARVGVGIKRLPATA